MSKRVLVVVAVAIVAVAGFLAFRPDKLVVDDRVDEDLSAAFVTTSIPPTTVIADSSVPTESQPTTTQAGSPVATDAADSEPVPVSTGSFVGVDHSAAGTATIFEKDGSFVLRFEDDTDIQNGPDLFVWLVEGADWDNPGDFLDLGKLKGNVGGQNYPLPAEYDPTIHRNVLIWCLRFAVPFAAAELS